MYKESIASEEVRLNFSFEATKNTPFWNRRECGQLSVLETMHSMKNGFFSKVADKGIVRVFGYNS